MQLNFSDYAHYSLLDVVLHLINKGPSRTQLLSQLYTCPEHKKRFWGRGVRWGEKQWHIFPTSCHADQGSNETGSDGRITTVVSIEVPSGRFVTPQKCCTTEHHSTWCLERRQRSLWFGVMGFRRLWFRWTGIAACKKLCLIAVYVLFMFCAISFLFSSTFKVVLSNLIIIALVENTSRI